MKFIEQRLSAMAWLQAFILLVITGAVAGLCIWLVIRGSLGIWLGISVAVAGAVAGVIFAEKARFGKGTIEFMPRTIAHPELREKKNK